MGRPANLGFGGSLSLATAQAPNRTTNDKKLRNPSSQRWLPFEPTPPFELTAQRLLIENVTSGKVEENALRAQVATAQEAGVAWQSRYEKLVDQMEALAQVRNVPPGTPAATPAELSEERDVTIEGLVRRHHREREALQLEAAAAVEDRERVTVQAMRLEHHRELDQASRDWAKQRQELVLTRAHYAEIAKAAQRQYNEAAVGRGLRRWQQILDKRDLQACSRCFHRMRRKLAIRATIRACKTSTIGSEEDGTQEDGEALSEEGVMAISALQDKVAVDRQTN